MNNSIDKLLNWLDQYLNFEHQPKKNIFWLDTMDFLCKKFGNPQKSFKCIHVAGSKGKGSVSKMIASILEEDGHKVGLYSSPHITDFRERISSANNFFPDEIYEKSAQELISGVEAIKLDELPGNRAITWFELVTLYAFLCFKNADCEYGVFEVGLGGRLDSTNIISPVVCAINPIELEHIEFLGDTLEKIAFEKAGIIKNKIPVFISKQQKDSVKEVFLKQGELKSAPVYFVEDFIKDQSYTYNAVSKKMKIDFTLKDSNEEISTELELPGMMQMENAQIAYLCVKQILPELSARTIEKGLKKAKLPGRFEIFKKNDIKKTPEYVLDGAHTINSVKFCLETLEKFYPETQKDLLFACAADKDVKEIAELFKGKFRKIYLTKPGNVKQSDLEGAKNAFCTAGLKFEYSEDFNKIIKEAFTNSYEDNTCLLITGSFYLLAEVLSYEKTL